MVLKLMCFLNFTIGHRDDDDDDNSDEGPT